MTLLISWSMSATSGDCAVGITEVSLQEYLKRRSPFVEHCVTLEPFAELMESPASIRILEPPGVQEVY